MFIAIIRAVINGRHTQITIKEASPAKRSREITAAYRAIAEFEGTVFSESIWKE